MAFLFCIECGGNLILPPDSYDTPSRPSPFGYIDIPVRGCYCTECGLIHPAFEDLTQRKKKLILFNICKEKRLPYHIKNEVFEDVKNVFCINHFSEIVAKKLNVDVEYVKEKVFEVLGVE